MKDKTSGSGSGAEHSREETQETCTPAVRNAEGAKRQEIANAALHRITKS